MPGRLPNAIHLAHVVGGATLCTMGLCPVPQPKLIFNNYLCREGQAHRAPLLAIGCQGSESSLSHLAHHDRSPRRSLGSESDLLTTSARSRNTR
jgi:hypothetical protein